MYPNTPPCPRSNFPPASVFFRNSPPASAIPFPSPSPNATPALPVDLSDLVTLPNCSARLAEAYDSVQRSFKAVVGSTPGSEDALVRLRDDLAVLRLVAERYAEIAGNCLTAARGPAFRNGR